MTTGVSHAQKKTCADRITLLYFLSDGLLELLETDGRRGPHLPVAPTEPSDLELPATPSPGPEVPRRRMNSFLLLSTVVASVGLSVALGALVLRVALKLLARNLAK